MDDMRLRELYRETFSQVHSGTTLNWEEMKTVPSMKRSVKAAALLAAAVGLLAVLTIGALAADLFGLRTMLLSRGEISMGIDWETGERPTQTVDMITLSGSLDTPEGKAALEWQEFLSRYDVEGAAWAADDDPDLAPAGYGDYDVYNREMADKLEEILAEYGLKGHGDSFDLFRCPAAMEMIGAAMGDLTVYPLYGYEDGSFQLEGEWPADHPETVSFQLRRVVRGYFDDVILNISDLSEYQEWTCSAGGQRVSLALGPGKALVLADRGDCMVTVNVLAGTESGLSAAGLESLAGSIDFSAFASVEPLTPDREDGTEEPAEDRFYPATGIREAQAQAFFAQLVRDLEEGNRQEAAERIAWPRTVCLGEETIRVEGPEEFLPYYDAIFTRELLDLLHTHQYDRERADLFYPDGALWFGRIEDGRIAVLTVQSPEGNRLA